MQLFACQQCGQLLYFENTRCERCGAALGFLAENLTLSALEEAGGGLRPVGRDGTYRFCANEEFQVCNWLVPDASEDLFCAACRHNRTVPDLTLAENRERWRRLEIAKHRLIYSLIALGLAHPTRAENPTEGLVFDFLSPEGADPNEGENIVTGHDHGLITLNALEADDAQRERIRTEMGEPYRTLLGHFRHESGHWYWNLLVRDSGRLEDYRARFGDEREDYGEALARHYEEGPPADWQNNFVSAYASAHPWEDFAETWAHYLHIVDALEAAADFGVRVAAPEGEARAVEPEAASGIEELIEAWLPLTFAVNSLNRSMGLPDLYPFVLSPAAIEKLGFVHDLVHGARAA